MNPHIRAGKPRASKKFRELLKAGRPLIAAGAPGAWYATLLERAGIDLIYSGANHVTRPLMGVSRDVIHPNEFTWINHWVARATDAPVIADLDNGFGGARRLSRIIEEAIASGVAGGRVEDDVAERPPLWWSNPPIAPLDESLSRIRAIAEVRDAMDPDFVIIAFCKMLDYTDDVDEAISRLQAYQEAGADILHLSTNSLEQVRIARKKLNGPFMCTGTDGRDIQGLMTVEEHAREGMGLVWYSNLLIWKLNACAVEWLEHVRKNGFGEWVKFHQESQRHRSIGASIQQMEVDRRMDEFEHAVWGTPQAPDEDGWQYVPGKMEIEGWEYTGGQPMNKANWRRKK